MIRFLDVLLSRYGIDILHGKYKAPAKAGAFSDCGD
jgi:hypothetical protein